MKNFVRKIGMLIGGIAAVVGLGSNVAQANPVSATPDKQEVSEKTKIVLTQTARTNGGEFTIASHYSHSSHSSHASHSSHSSHYSSN